MKKDVHDNLCLVGHPSAPIGMGEHVRATCRSLCKVAVCPELFDIYKVVQPDLVDFSEHSGSCQNLSARINLFHINGDEVEDVFNHIDYHKNWTGYNVIYPLWELPRYPSEWAKQLNRFDEIWAPSRFIFDSLQQACNKPVYHMPLSCEIVLNGFLGRRYFNIPEADYVFLFCYDLRSYSSRKNPQGVIQAFRQFLTLRPFSKVHLVIKVNSVETNPAAFSELSEQLHDLHANVSLIQRGMSNNEVKNLVRCCDCFISLHRSEGFGFGIAEAMVLGKPVIATAFSGNMDFMNQDVALCVDYKLIPVKKDEYPHYEEQVWADPDYDQAVVFMTQLVDDPGYGRKLGVRARLHMQSEFSYRQIGLNYVSRLDAIRAALA